MAIEKKKTDNVTGHTGDRENQQAPFRQPPYQQLSYSRKPSPVFLILSIILLSVGAIASIIGAVSLLFIKLKPDSTLAYYIRDMNETGLFGIFTPLGIGIILIVVGIIMLNIHRGRTKFPKL